MSRELPGGEAALLAITLVGCVIVTLSCGNPSGQGNGCQGTGANVVIAAQDNLTFDKPSVLVSKGSTVCWQNLGRVAHTVTHTTSSPLDTTWTLDAQLNPGGLVIHSFGTVGDYSYKCSIHPTTMTGLIQVR
jgi:plastocyanin